MSATITLLRHVPVAQGTMAFHFQRPQGFEFRAGQSIDVTETNPPETDAAGSTRTFTLASAPSESELMIATRMRDTAFKRVLRDAPAGFELSLEGPSGDFVLHRNEAKPAVFLAGGIGITPFLSIIRQTVAEGRARDICLLYSNNRPEDAAFLEELMAASQKNLGIRVVPTMTDMARSQQPWNGETGFIDAAMLQRHVSKLQGPIYYLAGPPAMVTAMRKMLVTASVDEDDIRTEEFAGY